MKRDPINHPTHYKGSNGLEAIEVIESFGLGFRMGNAVKYLLRCGKKTAGGSAQSQIAAEIEDLKKARWYVDRQIAVCERARAAWDRLDAQVKRNNQRYSKPKRRRK